MPFYLLSLFLILLAGWGVEVAEGASKAEADERPPINITAETMEYFNKENRAVFIGKVVAVQGDSTISSERMEVTLASEEENNSIHRIVALENVTFRQLVPETGQERFATGERAEYIAAERAVTLTGNPRAWEGKNVIVGEKMIFFLDDHRFLVEGEVGLTIYPEEGEEAE